MAHSERSSTRPSRAKRGPPHQHRLAAQAEQAIELSLADSNDPHLHNLIVHSVVPMQGKLCVRVIAEPDAACSLAELRLRLLRATSWLRREVAAEIHRKRAPELRFEILGATLDDTDTEAE